VKTEGGDLLEQSHHSRSKVNKTAKKKGVRARKTMPRQKNGSLTNNKRTVKLKEAQGESKKAIKYEEFQSSRQTSSSSSSSNTLPSSKSYYCYVEDPLKPPSFTKLDPGIKVGSVVRISPRRVKGSIKYGGVAKVTAIYRKQIIGVGDATTAAITNIGTTGIEVSSDMSVVKRGGGGKGRVDEYTEYIDVKYVVEAKKEQRIEACYVVPYDIEGGDNNSINAGQIMWSSITPTTSAIPTVGGRPAVSRDKNRIEEITMNSSRDEIFDC
jgi:hypothetical protein